ncbi:MAG: alpha/beta hydrolase [Acidobacteria bacterium]|nr:alpha/beta hydrolase [Acidobacteriota bacterium]
MKVCVLGLCLLTACAYVHAQAKVWQPSAGHTQVPIWPGKIPDLEPVPGPEYLAVKHYPVAGRPWLKVGNVSRPTMTVYSAKGTNTGAAVVVFPGGGFGILAIDLEGTEACRWLTSNGITCVLLKYRVPSAPYDWHCDCYRHGTSAVSVPALEDAQRTIRLVRDHAKEWQVNPHKVGVLGFSAGGYLVAETSADFNHQYYKPVDKADDLSDRPDFAIAVYPGHVATQEYAASHYGIPVGSLNPHLHFTKQTPPTFILQAENAKMDKVRQSLVYYTALAKVGVPAELHIYAEGGHAFGLRPTHLPITHWPKLVDTWLHTIGVVE